MSLPGFTAETSLYKTSEHYVVKASTVAATQGVTPQLVCPPPGTCYKAFSLCNDPTAGGSWCSIAARCTQCMFDGDTFF